MSLKTSTIGSFPRPVKLLRARWQFSEEEIEESALREIEQESIRTAIAFQESLGLDLFVDGQLDRSDMVAHFAEQLDGVEVGALVRCFGNRYYRRPRIVDPVGRPESITVDGWKAAQALTERPVKAIVTGPYTLMDWSFDEHYGSRENCCAALAEVVAAEVEDLVAAGANEIQIDEPAISGRPEEMKMIEQAIGRVTSKLDGRARSWLHLCYGDLTPVIGAVLNLPVHGFLIGMVQSRHELLNALDDLPGDKLLGGGVLDTVSSEIESVDRVRERIDALLGKIPADRFWVVPDAGLRALTGPQAEAKLRALVEAAAR